MAIKVNAAEFRERHATGLKRSTERIRKGVERVTESPMEKAVAQKEKMRQNVNAALDSGKWEAGLARVSLSEWKAKFLAKGITNIASGVDASAAKIEAFASQLLSYESTLQSKIDAMPSMTLEDSIARQTAWTRGMADFKRD